ncbi:MAG TPA: RHS repeat-associated core domain-containing protein [Terriglobia bacterium]|nr:RHS repeat-associated core domain-containing protein [Terriglobia bacterium]
MRSGGTRKGSQIAHYDSNGNLTSTGTGTGTASYNWDADGHMITDTVNGSATATATYDALGRMVERDQGSISVEVVYDPTGHRLAQMTGQTLAQAYVPLPAGGQAIYSASGLMYYYHPDWEGSVRLKSNTSRSVGGDAAYGPYGETYAASGGWLNVYAGIQDDFSPELDDAMLRRYNPTQGRWVSPDPLGGDITNSSGDEPGGPQSLNRYAYVMNNPTNLTDPLGLHPPSCNGIGCADNPRTYCGSYYCGYGGLDFTGAPWNDLDLLSLAATPTAIGIPVTQEGGTLIAGPEDDLAGYAFLIYGNIDAIDMVFIQSGQIQPFMTDPGNMTFKGPHAATMGILSGQNACSDFFDAAASAFSGSANAIFSAIDVGTFSGDPMVAGRSTQGAGASRPILLNDNPKGGFFHNLPGFVNGIYSSGSLGAQITTFLHEFGHTVNALQPDHDNMGLSIDNTWTVMDHCKQQINQAIN